MRARYLAESRAAARLGAHDVVAEEVEGGVEISRALLRWLEVPRNVIDTQLREARAATQTSERKVTVPRQTLGEMRALADLKIESVLIEAGASGAGKSAVQLDLRRQTGALVIAVQRGLSLLEQPDPHAPWQPGDVVFLAGTSDAIRKATVMLATPPESPVPLGDGDQRNAEGK